MGCLRRWSIFYVAIKNDLSKCNTNHIDKDSRKRGKSKGKELYLIPYFLFVRMNDWGMVLEH